VAEYRMIIYAALLIGLMLVRPQGLLNIRFGRVRI
jgi:branched-chain amino acid transport system permease protein